MDDIGSFWSFEENVDDLKQKLQFTTYELEITRKESNEEIRKNTDYIKKLHQLLQTACKERDEAKTQLNKLKQIMAFNNKPNNNVIDHIIPTTTTTTTTTTATAYPATPFSPDSPLLTTHFPTMANSSATESSSFSLETHNTTNNNNNNFSNHNQSHVSSPAASSPDSCNIVFSSSAAVTATIGMNQTTVKPAATVVDHESVIIASLAKGRALPQKGKLLQAVLEAGPLLSTLMVAGPLPQWRNPPGVLTHQIPPVNLKGCGGVINQSPPGCNKFYSTSQPYNLPQQSSYDATINGLISENNPMLEHAVSTTSCNSSMVYNGHNSYNGPFGHYPNSLLDFGNGSSSGSCYMGGRMMVNSGVSFDCHQIPKRQRIV